MAEQLKPMSVNPGDPITSELMASIVANINIINSVANSVIDSGSDGSGGSTGTPNASVIEYGRTKIPCKTDGTGSQSITFKKTFATQPIVTCTVYQATPPNFNKQKYSPIVISPTLTDFTIRMMPVGATSSGSIYVNWIAVGT
jgi:hypothetical protein